MIQFRRIARLPELHLLLFAVFVGFFNWPLITVLTRDGVWKSFVEIITVLLVIDLCLIAIGRGQSL